MTHGAQQSSELSLRVETASARGMAAEGAIAPLDELPNNLGVLARLGGAVLGHSRLALFLSDSQALARPLLRPR